MLKLSPHSMLHSQPQVRVATVAASKNQIERLTTSLPPAAEQTHYPGLEALCDTATETANLILVFQSHQDQFPAEGPARLRNRFPLACLLVVLDELSAAEGRNRSFWPVAWCVPDWKLQDRLAQELEVLSGSRPALATTADRDQIAGFELSTANRSCDVPTAPLISFSADPIWIETLRQLLREAAADRISVDACSQLSSLQSRLQASPASKLVFDVDPLEGRIGEWLQENRSLIADRHSIALSNWITKETQRKLMSAGFRAVVCKLNPLGIQRTIFE